MDFSYIDFHVSEDHLNHDKIHLNIHHQSSFLTTITTYIGALITTLSKVSPSPRRSRAAITRRNRHRHAQIQQKQKQHMVTPLMRPTWTSQVTTR
jgi:hypothetical protein